MNARFRFKIIVYLILAILAVSLLIWWLMFGAAKGRDWRRLADIKLIEGELNSYFLKFNTYIIPECPDDSLINYCLGQDKRRLNFAALVDPKNKAPFQYVMRAMTEDNFRLDFALEAGIGGLPAGNYSLSKEGIRK
jgi:type II secretory pathway pseudopilin PulG